MKRSTLITIAKYALFYLLVIIGVILFMVFAGEESPDSNLTTGEFFLIKFGAMGCMYGLFVIAKALYKAGAFPQSIYDEINEDEEV